MNVVHSAIIKSIVHVVNTRLVIKIQLRHVFVLCFHLNPVRLKPQKGGPWHLGVKLTQLMQSQPVDIMILTFLLYKLQFLIFKYQTALQEFMLLYLLTSRKLLFCNEHVFHRHLGL